MRPRLILLIGLTLAAACGKPTVGSVAEHPDPPAATATATPSASPSPAADSRLLVATKSKTLVTVSELDASRGVARTLFTYRERQPAEHSQNYWEEQPPSVAYAPKAGLVAYASATGLHTFDLATLQTTTLIEQISPSKNETSAPQWSPALEGAYGIHNVAVSSDGRYLSFDVSHYEGNTVGFWDLHAGRLFTQESLPFSYAEPSLRPAAWSTGVARTVVAASGGPSGVFVSAPGDPTRARLVELPHPWVGQARLSPDGATVAYLFGTGADDPTLTGVAIARADGTARRTIETSGVKSGVAVGDDGVVWWTERGALYRWDGTAVAKVAALDAAFEWEIARLDAGEITLSGRDPKAGRGTLVVVDTATGEKRTIHRAATDFVRYLG